MAILRFIFAFVLVLLAVSASARLTRTDSTIDFAFPNGSINTCSGEGVTNNSLASPTDVYIYQNLLLINDFDNSRVLAVDQTTKEAVAVFGQVNFTTRTPTTSTTGLNLPYGIYVNDATNTLYVADSGNNRVTGYALASLRNGGNQAAQVVLGQANFTSKTAGTSETTLSGPRDVFVDTTGNRLWVLDYTNRRALWYNNGLLGFTNGQAASGVIGTTNITDFSSVGTFFQTPNGILVDRQGRLYIADTSANRVIRYDSATVNTPSLAFGQIDLTATANATTATGLNYPRSIAYDLANDILFVSDLRNNRVVGYPKASNITTNGTAATIVVGQSSLTSNGGGCSATNFNKTYGIYYNDAESILAVADLNNERAVEFFNNITQNVSVSNSLSTVSISFTNTAAPSATASSTVGLCVSCQSSDCSGTAEFDNICRRSLGGTGRREDDFYCCVGATPSKTTNNRFTFPSKNSCSNKQKLMDLCSRLNGKQTCASRKSSNPDISRTTTICQF